MIRRFFSRVIVRSALVGLLVSLFLVQGWFGALLGWLVTGYLLWRAFPAVRKDLRFLWRGIPSATKTMARF
jgi:hypothetical protein